MSEFDEYDDLACALDKAKKNTSGYPVHCLPIKIKDIVDDCVRMFSVDADLAASAALAVLSASVGKGAMIKTHKYINTANIYMLGCARSGTGKSIASKKISLPLYNAEIALRESSKKRIAESLSELEMLKQEYEQLKKDKKVEREAKIKELAIIKQTIEEVEKNAAQPTLIAEDVTSQKLACLLMDNNEQLSIISLEANAIYQQWQGRYNGNESDENIYLAASTGDPLKVHRMGRGEITLIRPTLSLFALSTPDLMAKLFENERFMQGGLLARCFVFESPTEPKHDDGREINENESAWLNWGALIHNNVKTFNSAMSPAVMKASKESCDILREYGNERISSNERDLDQFKARQAEKAERICLLLHIAESEKWNRPIEAETAKAAVEIVRWYEKQTELLTSASRFEKLDKEARALYELILTKYQGTATMRDLKRRHGKKDHLLRLLAKNHPEMFEIQEVRPDTGRPSEVMKVKK